MRIYSDKFPDAILWDDPKPAGVIGLDVKSTDDNLHKLYELKTDEYLNGCDIDNVEYGFLMSHARDRAWEGLFDDTRADACYVWIKDV